MNKVILLVAIFALLSGCGNSKSKQESVQNEKQPDQYFDNILNEDISLLSSKYKIPKDTLKKIIGEYELMVYGFNITNSELFIEKETKTDKVENFKVISVQEAIRKLSSKYQIQESIISSILIEKKSMQRCSSE